MDLLKSLIFPPKLEVQIGQLEQYYQVKYQKNMVQRVYQTTQFKLNFKVRLDKVLEHLVVMG